MTNLNTLNTTILKELGWDEPKYGWTREKKILRQTILKAFEAGREEKENIHIIGIGLEVPLNKPIQFVKLKNGRYGYKSMEPNYFLSLTKENK